MSNDEIDFNIRVLEEKLRIQFDEMISPIDRSSSMVGFIAVLIGILITLNSNGMVENQLLFGYSLILIVISLGLSFILGFIRIFKFRRDPKPNYFICDNKFKKLSLHSKKIWLMVKLLNSYNENKVELNKINKLYKLTGAFLIVGMIVLAISVWS